MKKRSVVLWTALALFFTAWNLPAEVTKDTIVFIVNPANPIQSLTLDQVEALYRNQIRYWPDGRRVHLYDMEVDASARIRFSQSLLDSTPSRVERDWMQRTLINEMMSIRSKVMSPTVMQERVASDPRAIGYVLRGDLTKETVRIVATLD